jgi:hypothetical protein
VYKIIDKMSQNITIIISNQLNLNSIIRKLSDINTEIDLNLNLEISCQGFIQADVYLILVSFVNSMISEGKKVNVVLINKDDCPAVTYASRIDFFKHLNIDYDEKIVRKNSSGNLIPITNIGSGVMDLSNEILTIFKKDFNMKPIDVSQLSLIISEMFCNTTIHSKSKSGAYLYCQKYKKTANYLEFILVDSGIGIKNSLQKNKKYENISNRESIVKAIQYGITCGEGRGHGLYFASEFVKRNNGEMVLISGDDRIIIKNNVTNFGTNHCWNGVYLKLLLKFDSEVSLNDLMAEKMYTSINPN